MSCQEMRESLSLYLYGELDFAHEEALETHLEECAFCQRTLEREKLWHAAAKSGFADVPLPLLAECRQQLRPTATVAGQARSRWLSFFDISFDRWSPRLALASLLVFAGFAGGRWFNRADFAPAPAMTAGFVREIEPTANGNVKIVLQHESEITGRPDDRNIRKLLVDAARQDSPEVRYYSLLVLNGQGGNDFRELLAHCLRNDPNPAVRLQAVEGLRHFAGDPAVLDTLQFTLEHDANPSVRSAAIEVLVPADSNAVLTNKAAQVLQDVMRSQQDDEYLRARCTQILQQAKFPVIY